MLTTEINWLQSAVKHERLRRRSASHKCARTTHYGQPARLENSGKDTSI